MRSWRYLIDGGVDAVSAPSLADARRMAREGVERGGLEVAVVFGPDSDEKHGPPRFAAWDEDGVTRTSKERHVLVDLIRRHRLRGWRML